MKQQSFYNVIIVGTKKSRSLLYSEFTTYKWTKRFGHTVCSVNNYFLSRNLTRNLGINLIYINNNKNYF